MRVQTRIPYAILLLVCVFPACGPAQPPEPTQVEAADPAPAAAPAPIQPSFEDGKAAYDREDYTTALRHWVPLAKQGDPRAQNNLGKMYFLGQGVPEDHSVAIRWFGDAAVGGADYALLSIAEMHRYGLGTPMDLEQAYIWYTLAVTRGVDGADAKRSEMAGELTAEQKATAEGLAREWADKQAKAAPAQPTAD